MNEESSEIRTCSKDYCKNVPRENRMRCEQHAQYNREYYQRTKANKRKRKNHCSKCGKPGHQIVTCDLVSSGDGS